MKLNTIIFLTSLSWLVSSCGGDTNPLDKVNDFEQRPLLENLSSNLILPAFSALKAETENLSDSIENLADNPNSVSLLSARDQLKSARLAWQACSFYQFGPSETYGLTAALNIYPVDKNQIANNISSGSYDLTLISNQDARGFPALEYLLYGEGLSDEELLTTLDASTLGYITDLTDEIIRVVTMVEESWRTDYTTTFTSESALGIDVGSSVGQMLNGYIQHFERHTRDGKIGIPVGIRSLGEPVLGACEAYFAGYSLELFNENIKEYKRLFNGGESVGYDDYLKGIGAATTGNEDLADRINSQFDVVLEEASKLSGPLPDAITNQKEQVELVFAEMQTLVTFFKTDMASSIGITISYQDSDGD